MENPKICDNYIHLYKQFCIQNKLFDCGKLLWQSIKPGQPLTIEQMMEFKTIDALGMKGMNIAEKQCHKMHMGAIEWSPQIAAARNHIAAWMALCWAHKVLSYKCT